MLHAKAQYNWIQEVHLHVLHSNILFAANLQRDLTMIWSKASEPIGWSNNSLFVTQKNVTFPQLLQFSSWCCLYVPPTFFFPVGNWIPQTVNQTWKTIAILNLSKSSTPQNVAATPFFSWKMSWSFGDWDDWGPKNISSSSESPTFWPCKNLIPNLRSIKDLLHPFWERPCWSQSRTISFPEPNLWCFRFLRGSAHFLKGYGMIRPMFMLEEKMVCFSGRCQSVFLEINIKIFTAILGSTKIAKIVVLMVSVKGVRRSSKMCVCQSHFTLILAIPKPIYGIQYNFTLPGTRSCESSSTRS